MNEKKTDVTKKYNREIRKIANKLHDLEQGRVYELSKARMDGYLATNVVQLREMIADLVNKIEYGEDSIDDKISEALSKFSIGI